MVLGYWTFFSASLVIYLFIADRDISPGRERGKGKDHDPSAARRRPERPCRVLFVRNINYDANEAQIRNIFGKYGEIKSIFDLIQKRGMAFVTFVCTLVFIIRKILFTFMNKSVLPAYLELYRKRSLFQSLRYIHSDPRLDLLFAFSFLLFSEKKNLVPI